MTKTGKGPSSARKSKVQETARTPLVRDLQKAARALKREYDTLPARQTKGRNGKMGGWAEIGRRHGVTARDAYRLAVEGIAPKDVHKRLALGLPAYAEAPICPIHGKVHEGRCPAPKRAPVDLFGWAPEVLALAISRRTEYK